MKVLNLYAGIGGNRKLWPNDIEVTAVEINPEIAAIYQKFFPNDKVIVADAHQYLLDHYEDFNFIWSSPPCVTHSRARYWASKGKKYLPKYPDLKLYEEIIFLNAYLGRNQVGIKWVVENVNPYYSVLYTPIQEIGRHCFWSNFFISKISIQDTKIHNTNGNSKLYGFDISNKKIGKRKDQIMRNLVNPRVGIHVWNCAFKEKQEVLI